MFGMQIGVLGINHKLANLVLREAIVKGCREHLERQFANQRAVGCVFLATCNRVEIYFSSPDLAKTHSELLGILCDKIEEECAHKVYSYFGEDCFLHLAKVTAGIDSALVFETEIQGQVKQAYRQAMQEQKLCAQLHFLFQKCLFIGKKVRSLFPLSNQMPSLEGVITAVATHLFGELATKRILFVGISAINEKIASFFQQEGVEQLSFCNRSVNKRPCTINHAPVFGLERLDSWVDFDLVILGTHCPHFLLSHKRSLARTGHKKLLIDLSVPRNVDPAMGRLRDVTLMNIDQLHRLVDRKKRRQGQMLARIMLQEITSAVERHLLIYRAKAGVSVTRIPLVV